MDLTYMPGELDNKNEKKIIKREHDSVDDFEHLDPDLSPVDALSKKSLDTGKLNSKTESDIGNFGDFLTGETSKEVEEIFSKSKLPSETEENVSDFMSDSDFSSHLKSNIMDLPTHANENLLNFEIDRDVPTINESGKGISDLDAFISAEKDDKISRNSELESDLLGSGDAFSGYNPLEPKELSEVKDFDAPAVGGLVAELEKDESGSEDEFDFSKKSMKAADALAQYDIKPEIKPDNIERNYFGDFSPSDVQETSIKNPAVEQDDDPNTIPAQQKQPSDLSFSKTDISSKDNKIETLPEEVPKPVKESSPKPVLSDHNQEPSKTQEPVQKPVKKASVQDLDDIIGPEDVFKRIGLDAWFTPERLHPKVEALVYWRDPKQSGIVFGGIMAILLSFCYMSLISVVAYFSLFALLGAIAFRIYKTILQAIQKTNEGHPFKDYLELDLSLPQDKVREIVDTAVVHINAGIVELRRLFLVEDLIDSVKFAVCLWCLTFIGAIFNGMTLVILAFVALFTVPKIYENNKASIDQYIEVGRSKVAEITSKVKAAVPIGKKEPEKDKEQ